MYGTTKLLTAATTTGAGGSVRLADFDGDPSATFQAVGSTSAGAGAATVLIEGSNDNANWLTVATITLTLSTSAATDGFYMNAPWANVRANLSAISGTGASIDVIMGA